MKPHGTNLILVAAGLLLACDRDTQPTSASSPPSRVQSINAVAVSTVDLNSLDPPCAGVLVPIGTTLSLTMDCTTNTTIMVPTGFTLNGNGHTITAIDPVPTDPTPAPFLGAVVMNAGATANVTNVMITGDLGTACQGGATRLRGILLDGASGSITATTVTHIKRGASNGCQEGNAIEVRSCDGAGTQTATIDNSTVSDYQKTGILANCDVVVSVTANTVQGVGPVDYIAQNGVQIGFGASGEVSGNTISDNFYTGCSNRDAAKTGCTPFVSAGLLLFDIDPSTVRRSNNMYRNNQFNVLLVTHQSLDS